MKLSYALTTLGLILLSEAQCGHTRGHPKHLRNFFDANGDGYEDKVVAAVGSDIGGTDKGSVFIYYGSAAGLKTTDYTTITYPGSDSNSNFGVKVASAGDVNGDGYSDLFVGANISDIPGVDFGAAFIFYGSELGITTANYTTISYPGTDASANFASSAASAGDVNGDGYDDVIVGAYQSDIKAVNEGIAFLYYGSASGLQTTDYVTLRYSASDPSPSFGRAVSSAGDVNHDGYDDVAVGAGTSDIVSVNKGAVFVYYGSSSGLQTSNVTTLSYPYSDGSSVFGLNAIVEGDFNGDGYDDIAISAQLSDYGGFNRGAIVIFYGTPDGISTTGISAIAYPDTDSSSGFSSTLASEDFDHDGFDDLVTGAQASQSRGAAYIYYGSPSGIVGTSDVTILNYPSTDTNSLFGISVSAGDINHDGYGDIIVGAQTSDVGGSDQGAAFVYYGSPTRVQPASTTILYPSTDTNTAFGASTASVDTPSTVTRIAGKLLADATKTAHRHIEYRLSH